MNAELGAMLRIAAQAAKVVMQVYAGPFGVDYKGPSDPVTLADRLANELIVTQLRREFPGVPVVAEESDPASFADYRSSQQVFFVDPVDGTREFVDRNGEFAVMIGLLDGARALGAVIDAPARGEVFAGWVGAGAFRSAAGVTEAIRVSDVSELPQARLVGSRSQRSPVLDRAIAELKPREVQVLGSAGLKGTLVASGIVEAYVAPGYAGKRWDACAVDALVSAAGGRLTDTYGDPLDYRAASLNNDRGLVASNGRVHDVLVSSLRELYRNQAGSDSEP